MRRETVRLATNVPQQLALERDGVPSRDNKVRYDLVDGRALILDLDAAARLTNLDLNLGEPFWICLRWTGRPGETAYYDLWLDPAIEKKRAKEEESELTRQLEASLAMRNIPWNGGRSRPSTIPEGPRGLPNTTARPGDETNGANTTPNTVPPVPRKEPAMAPDPAGLLSFEELLTGQANLLTNAYAACLRYATATHGGAVSRDDIRTFVVTAYISQTQGRRGFRSPKENAA